MDPVRSGIVREGNLFDNARVLLKKQKFHVYQNGKMIAYGKSNLEGRFSIRFNPEWIDHKMVLTFRHCNEKNHAKDIEGILPHVAKKMHFLKERTETQECTITIQNNDVQDLGDVIMQLKYEKEQAPLSYQKDFLTAGAAATIKSQWEHTKAQMNLFSLDDDERIEEIMKNFKVERVPLTDENLWKFLTNGLCPIHFKVIKKQLVAEVNWDDIAIIKNDSVPNAKVYFYPMDANATYARVEKIEIQFRKSKPEEPLKHKKVELYTSNDPNYEKGMRKALSAFFRYGQIVYHFGFGHLIGAEYADLIHDFLPGTKLGEYLSPISKLIEKITFEKGGPNIVGETGIIPQMGALPAAGVAKKLHDVKAAFCPFTFLTRKPMNEKHDFAHVQNHHYTNVNADANDFINKNWAIMITEWEQMSLFFEKVHSRSPLYRPWEGIPPESGIWFDTREIGGNVTENTPERTKYKDDDAGVRAARRIAKKPYPEKHDKEMIINFCNTYRILVQSWHSWIHPSQYKQKESAPCVKDVNFAPLILRNFGNAPYGGMDVEDVLKQETLGAIFDNFPVHKYALVNSNESEGLKERVKKTAHIYEKYGLDPFTELTFTTVI